MTVLLENEPRQCTSSASNIDAPHVEDTLDDSLLKIQNTSFVNIMSNAEDNDTHASNPTSSDDYLSEGFNVFLSFDLHSWTFCF